jgi:hypothetical protein
LTTATTTSKITTNTATNSARLSQGRYRNLTTSQNRQADARYSFGRMRLFWMREIGCHTGTVVGLETLEPPLRQKVADLLEPEDSRADSLVQLHLPFMDARDWKRRAGMYRDLELKRELKRELTPEGAVIRPVARTASAELRDRAALLMGTHPAWSRLPRQSDRRYFRLWQPVSLALQAALRRMISETYFADVERYEDRDAAYPLLVYQASRLCYGQGRMDLTFDVADPQTMVDALKMTGRALRTLLEGVEQRLMAAGKPELAHRYAPIWHEDVVRKVQQSPRAFMHLLGNESAIIHALLQLGTSRGMEAVKPFARTTGSTLRSVGGVDMRHLGLKLLDVATECLDSRALPAVTVERVSSGRVLEFRSGSGGACEAAGTKEGEEPGWPLARAA